MNRSFLFFSVLVACSPDPEDPTEEPSAAVETDLDADGHASIEDGGDDCDDDDSTVFAGAPEACDGVDTDCDGILDPAVLFTLSDGSTRQLDLEQTLTDETAPAAVSLRDDGELRFCTAGTYYMNLSVQNAAVSVVGSGFEDVILDGSGKGVVVSASNATLTIEGVTLTHGYGTSLGGGMALTGSTAELSRVLIEQNEAGSGGGIGLSDASSVRLTDTTIRDNLASSGGGIALYKGSSAYLYDSFVWFNSALYGGGVDMDGSLMNLTKVSIAHNEATYSNGGGVYLWSSTINFITPDSRIFDNAAAIDGGGMYFFGSVWEGEVYLYDNTPDEYYVFRG